MPTMLGLLRLHGERGTFTRIGSLALLTSRHGGAEGDQVRSSLKEFGSKSTPALLAIPVTSDLASEAQTMDSSGLGLLVVYIALALGVSFLCSVAEAVLLSITPSYIESTREKRPRRAALLKRLRQDNVDRSLAAILTLNTIAHTVGAINAGTQAAVVFGSAWIGVFSAVMTLAILFLSEIVPKTIGAVYWTSLVAPMVYFVQGLIILLFPLVWLSDRLTRLISRGKSVHLFSRAEFMAMADIGRQTGHIDEHESRIMKNLLRFDSLSAEDVMTPRTVVAAFQQDQSIAATMNDATSVPFSRLPIYGEGVDDITGFVLKDDMLAAMADGEGEATLRSIKRDILAVPASVKLSRLLEMLVDHHQHIAFVVDEFGGMGGLVTLEDVIETLLGMEIMDELDKVEDLQLLARQQWQKRAKLLARRREQPDDQAPPSGDA